MAQPLAPEKLANIQGRAEYYRMRVDVARLQNSRKDRLRKVGGFPSPDIHVAEEQRYYAEDVVLLLTEIERLKAQTQELEAKK